MNFKVHVLAGSLLLTVGTSLAGEKQQGNMHAPNIWVRDACYVTPVFTIQPTSAAFVNGTSKGKFQITDKCKLSIKLVKLTDPGTLAVSDGIAGTGDEVLCLVHLFDDFAGACEGILLRGEVKGNNPAARKVVIKADLAGETGLCTPGSGITRSVAHVECYEPQPAFNLPAACAVAPGSVTPFVSDPTQGVCGAASNYMPNPVSPLIAILGFRE